MRADGYQPPPGNTSTVDVVQQDPSWRGRESEKGRCIYRLPCIICIGIMGSLINLMGITAIAFCSMNRSDPVFETGKKLYPSMIVGIYLHLFGIILIGVSITLARIAKRKRKPQQDRRHNPSSRFERESPVPSPELQMMRRSPSPRRLSPFEVYGPPQPSAPYLYSSTGQTMDYLTPDTDPPPPYNSIAPPPHQMPLPSAPGIIGDSSMRPGIENCPPPPYASL